MRVTTQAIHDRIDTTSHDRAVEAVDDDHALIETTDLDRHYRIMLPGSSQGVHETMIAVDRWGHMQGACDCAQMEYGDGLCAHILTLLLARQRGIETIDGQPITAGDRHDHGQPDDDPEIPTTLLPATTDSIPTIEPSDPTNVDPDPVTIDDDAVETGSGITVDGGIETDDNWSDRL